jgi:superfamily II DNA or RNA helicase
LATLAKRELTVAPIDTSGRFPKRFAVWRGVDDVVIVPRFWAVDKGIPLTEHWPDPVTIDPAPEFCGTLRDQQPIAVDATLRSLTTTGGAILSAAVGEGKTCMACRIIAHLGLKTVVLVHKHVLLDQWKDRLAQFLPGVTVSSVRGSAIDVSGDVVVAMLQTVVARPELRFPGAGLVIADEAHHMSAETFSTALRNLCCRYSLGLSATPDRKDGLVRVMHWLLGPLAYESKRENMRHVSVDVLRYTCDRYGLPPIMTRFGKIDHVTMISEMVADETRTQRIVDRVLALLHDPLRVVLVLSHRRDHCTDIARRIGHRAVAFLGGAKKTETSGASAVCATYAVASEGYDDPRLNALVLATPSGDVRQAVGRILRTSCARPRLIVDVQDAYAPAYAHTAKRKAYYRQAGFQYLQPYLFSS